MANERLFDPDLAHDPLIKESYLNFKKQIEQTKEQTIAIQERIAVADDEIRRKRIKKIFNDYTEDIDFDSLKKIVHNLIRKITVQWNIDDFGKGFFVFQIDYKLSDQRFLFKTNRTAMNWLLLSRYRKNAITPDELEDDKDLGDELGWSVDENFEGLETISSNYDLGVVLKRNEFIYFD